MTVATLMNINDPSFNFDHRIAHEAMLIDEVGSVNFSGIPYWLDPVFGDTAVPSGWENTLHAQAHADFLSLFPAPNGGSGMPSLNDVTLNDETSAWWQFSNFQLHYTASQLSGNPITG